MPTASLLNLQCWCQGNYTNTDNTNIRHQQLSELVNYMTPRLLTCDANRGHLEQQDAASVCSQSKHGLPFHSNAGSGAQQVCGDAAAWVQHVQVLGVRGRGQGSIIEYGCGDILRQSKGLLQGKDSTHSSSTMHKWMHTPFH